MSAGHGLIQVIEGPWLLLAPSCLQGPSQPVCPNTQRRRADFSPALTGDAKNPLIKIILSRAFFLIDV